MKMSMSHPLNSKLLINPDAQETGVVDFIEFSRTLKVKKDEINLGSKDKAEININKSLDSNVYDCV